MNQLGIAIVSIMITLGPLLLLLLLFLYVWKIQGTILEIKFNINIEYKWGTNEFNNDTLDKINVYKYDVVLFSIERTGTKNLESYHQVYGTIDKSLKEKYREIYDRSSILVLHFDDFNNKSKNPIFNFYNFSGWNKSDMELLNKNVVFPLLNIDNKYLLSQFSGKIDATLSNLAEYYTINKQNIVAQIEKASQIIHEIIDFIKDVENKAREKEMQYEEQLKEKQKNFDTTKKERDILRAVEIQGNLDYQLNGIKELNKYSKKSV